MDSRTAAHTLTQIAAFLELNGESRFRIRAYESAARAIRALGAADLRDMLRSGELAKVSGVGPATVAVVRDLVETGESSMLERLRESTPEGLLELLSVPGLGLSRLRTIHEALGVESLQELAEAAQDGRLASLPRFGPRTAEKILKGIEFLRSSHGLMLYPQARAESELLVRAVREHPAVNVAEVAGDVRRCAEVVGSIEVVAGCREPVEAVAASFAHGPGVVGADGIGGGRVRITYVDGTLLELHCVPEHEFAVTLWKATGSVEHVAQVERQLSRQGLQAVGHRLRDAAGADVPVPHESDVYRLAGLPFLEPELREGAGEVEAGLSGSLPRLIRYEEIRGNLHAHSRFSDGTASIEEMVDAARARGWDYLGITDHSQAAFYAQGMKPEQVVRQHAEMDELNARLDGEFVVLKGIEADILADGRVDYDSAILDSFDFVIASVHSRFSMGEAQMTERVLRALDDPHVTILAHPTGRLLLNREPYSINLAAVMEKAAEAGVALELNADPHRLDLSWEYCREARERGALVAIGTDAHSTGGLDHMRTGVQMARKAWLEARDVLNSRTAQEVLEFARRRRAGRTFPGVQPAS
jgi:DNA polymerase (family 10)